MGTYPIRHTPDRQKLKLTEARISVAHVYARVAHEPAHNFVLSRHGQPAYFRSLFEMGSDASIMLSLSLSLHTDARLERRYPLTPICIGSPLLVGGQSTGTTPQH